MLGLEDADRLPTDRYFALVLVFLQIIANAAGRVNVVDVGYEFSLSERLRLVGLDGNFAYRRAAQSVPLADRQHGRFVVGLEADSASLLAIVVVGDQIGVGGVARRIGALGDGLLGQQH